MQLFAPAVILPACLTRVLVDRRVRAGLIVVLGSICSMVLGALVVAGPTLNFIRALGDFESVDAGWRLPPVSAVNLLGFQRDFVPGWSGVQWVGTIALICLVVLAALALRHRKPKVSVFTIVTVGLLAASSWLLADRFGGDAYRVWKWVSFFQPIGLIAVLGCLAVALIEIPRLSPRATSGRAIVGVVLAGLLGAAVVNGRFVFDQIRGSEQVDIRLGSQLEQLFAIDVVPTRLKRSVSPSYVVVLPPGSRYTLVRRDEIGPAPISGTRVLNHTYALVPTRQLPAMPSD
jgi:hypothetical protein